MKTNYTISIISAIFIGALFLTSCAHAVKVLDVPMVSMTKSVSDSSTSIPEVESIGDVHGEYCADTFGTYDVGLIDNVVKEVQDHYKIDYIKEAVFSIKGTHCMQLVGEGLKIKK